MNKKMLKIFLDFSVLISYVLFYLLIEGDDLLDVMLCIVFFLLLKNILFKLSNLVEHGFYVIFNIVIFLFLLSRPIIASLYGIEWDYIGAGVTQVNLFIIGLSLLSINIGYELFWIGEMKIKDGFPKKVIFLPNKRTVFILFLLFSIINFYVEFVKYNQLKDLNYEDIYTNSLSLPYILVFLSSLYIYFFIANLALLPNKKVTYLTFFIFVMSIFPSVLLGERVNMAVLFVFFFVYILLRQKINNKISFVSKKNNVWFDFKKLLMFLIIVPMISLFFSVVQDMRTKDKEHSVSNIGYLVNFAYLQGTSFDTISQGIRFEEDIKSVNTHYINYSFGPVIDKVLYSKLGKVFWGLGTTDSGNSLNNVEISNNLAHPLSYIVLGESYLSGHGRGSSYILENYLDFGYIGVFFLSAILGAGIRIIWNSSYSSFFINNILLTIIMYSVLLPRINYSFNIVFLFDMKFWLVIFLIFILGKLVKKEGG